MTTITLAGLPYQSKGCALQLPLLAAAISREAPKGGPNQSIKRTQEMPLRGESAEVLGCQQMLLSERTLMLVVCVKGAHLVPDVNDVGAVVAAVDAAALGAAAKAAVVAVVLRQAQVVHRQHVDVRTGGAALLQPAHYVGVVVVLAIGRRLACHLARQVLQVLADGWTCHKL